MTSTWHQMARTALDGLRLWRGAVRRAGTDEGALGFSAVDFAVLSLVLDLVETDEVACAEAPLRAALEAVWAEQSVARQVLASPSTSSTLRLTTLGAAVAPEGTGAVHLVYGLGRGLALGEASPEMSSGFLRPLSSSAPALWQCGLALLAGPGGRAAADALTVQIGLAMRGEWIDPLALYERVQDLTAKLRGIGHIEAADPEAKLDRIAELEHEIASLKRAALVSQHLLLVDAAERARGTA